MTSSFQGFPNKMNIIYPNASVTILKKRPTMLRYQHSRAITMLKLKQALHKAPSNEYLTIFHDAT